MKSPPKPPVCVSPVDATLSSAAARSPHWLSPLSHRQQAHLRVGVASGWVALALAALTLGRPGFSQDGGAADTATLRQPLTVAEASNYTATSRSAEVETFLETCAEQADHVRTESFGQTNEGRPLTAAIVAQPAYDPQAPDDRVVALLLGNIHSGECAGKEALLRMLRELTYEPDHRWLDRVVFVFVPNYNADGNDRIAEENRPGQVGPSAGMGERPNAQGLDLNRDFMKLESPEARALVRLMNRYQPHLFIDCHTTNGSRHRYSLTFDVPHNPLAPPAVVQFLREQMIPSVIQAAKERGHDMFYYGNFNRDRSAWRTYGAEPRYSTEYGGLRGCLSLLSEAYAYIPYRDRIEATEVFVSSAVDYLHSHAAKIQELLRNSRDSFVDAPRTADEQTAEWYVPLELEQVPFQELATILAYDGEDPAELTVRFYGRYVASRQRPMPFAYLLPARWKSVAERLADHGIQVEVLQTAEELPLQTLRCTSLERARRPFQGHRLRQVRGDSFVVEEELPAGTFVVRTAQPLGRIAAYLLDPESTDGLTAWNFFDEGLTEGANHPVRWLAEPRTLPTQAWQGAKSR